MLITSVKNDSHLALEWTHTINPEYISDKAALATKSVG